MMKVVPESIPPYALPNVTDLALCFLPVQISSGFSPFDQVKM